MNKFHKRFSLPHWDGYVDDNIFYRLIKNSAPEFKAEIRDIYFGGDYHYVYKGMQKTYGEIMGATASPVKVNNLFRIQDELGIPISLTLNSMSMGKEIGSDNQVINGLIEYIKSFYDRGLRICTISATHLMRTERLQEAFPEMHWKNTVNHLVKTTQEVYDYVALGYNTILLDRSLNRDINTLKEVYVETKKLGVETSLLASEACMPSCPFKGEHDDWQSELQKTSMNYWQTFSTTCAMWNEKTKPLPRIGTNISMATTELADLFFDNVDVLKFSGRLGSRGNVDPNGRMCWVGVERPDFYKEDTDNTFEYANSFTEIYERNLAPFINDRWVPQGWTNLPDPQQHTTDKLGTIWVTDKGKKLSKVLSTCKNKCWDCHLCEKTFEVEEFNSVLAL